MKRKGIAMLVAALIAGCSSSGRETSSAQESEAEPGLLRAAMRYDITTADVAETMDDYMIPMNIFERLFETRPDGENSRIENSLCTSWDVSEDGLTYTFEIVGDAVFSNGNRLTAEDVRYSFERLLLKNRLNTEIPMEIAGAEELMRGETDHLSGFEIMDDTHFSITLKAPNAGFTAELSSPVMSIIDEESVKNAKNFGKDPLDTIGSGPYVITEWAANDHFVLEYNTLYHGPEPSVKKAIIKVIPDPNTQNLMFQNGELDIIDLASLDSAIIQSVYRTEWKDHIIARSKVGLIFLGMNENNPYLKDVRVRQAIGKAINVDELITGVYNGDARRESGIIPAGVTGHNDSLEGFVYDPEGAVRILDEAGYKKGEIQFELSMDSIQSGSVQLAFQAVSQQLAEIGIKAEIKRYDHTSWLDRCMAGKADAYIGRWAMDYNDPANIMITFFGGPLKTASRSLNYSDTEIMERVIRAPGITDENARIAEYRALEKKIISEDAAWIPLVSEIHLYCTGNRVKSYTPHWAGYGDFYVTDVVLN